MAQQVNEQLAGRRSIYPWDNWLDGTTWKLLRGASKDYRCLTDTMIRHARRTASSRGKKVHVSYVKDGKKTIGFLLQAIPSPKKERKKKTPKSLKPVKRTRKKS